VIQEGLRLAFGVSTRLQRLCPDEELIFDDGHKAWKIPRNVSSSGFFFLQREAVALPVPIIIITE
jgi:hypothetical protein